MQSRKIRLFYNQDEDDDIDTFTECWDGAEFCKLVGSYLPTQMAKIIDKNSIGLYRVHERGVHETSQVHIRPPKEIYHKIIQPLQRSWHNNSKQSENIEFS